MSVEGLTVGEMRVGLASVGGGIVPCMKASVKVI